MKNSVLTKIENNFKGFIKPFKKVWRNELIFSVIIPSWYKREEYAMVEELLAYSKSPSKLSAIANIVNVLEEHYPFDSYEYEDETYVSVAIKIYKKFRKKIKAIFKKWYHKEYKRNPMFKPFHIKEEAFKELVARGFIPRECFEPDPKKYHIKSTIGSIIYPKEFKDQDKGFKFFYNRAVTGYTGIYQPGVK